MKRYALCALIAILSVIAGIYFLALATVPSSDDVLIEVATPTISEDYVFSEESCSQNEHLRLAASPSELERTVIFAAVSSVAKGQSVLVGQTTTLDDHALDALQRHVKFQHLKFERVVEPSAVDALRFLAKDRVPIEVSDSNIGVKIVSSLEAAEIVAERIGHTKRVDSYGPSILRTSRAGIGCSLSHAIVYVSMSCGSLCGRGELIELELFDNVWRVIGTILLWVS
jgi:hypothetical protein